MTEKTDYKKIGKGLYKIAFCMCIFVLCVITVVITGNYEKSATTDLKPDDSVQTNQARFVSGEPKEQKTEIQDEEAAKDSTIVSQSEEKDISNYIPEFIPPVKGEVLKDFSDNVLLYNKTMDDWRIHTGIDILCPYGTEVLSCEKGTVTDVGYDMLFGNYVEVTLNDFVLRYTSLETGITHSVGDEINKGDVVGYLSDSCISEVCDMPHLHFEMKKSGEYVNPREFIY